MTFADTQIFIDSGWQIVPYESITYDSNGKKVAYPPIKWKDFVYTKNTKISKAGALICGEILVVDCDSLDSTLEFLRVLNIDGLRTIDELHTFSGLNQFIGLVVKTTRGYHFYFKNTTNVEDCKFEKIDIQATNKKLVYLPTETSEGKEIVTVCKLLTAENKYVIDLTPTPQNVLDWIKASQKVTQTHELKESKKIQYTLGTPLAKIPYGSPNFFKRLTPRSYRMSAKYRQMIEDRGYLYPNDIQDGDGNEYLTCVAGILSTDQTIDSNKFWSILEYINSLWDRPLTTQELHTKLEGYVLNKYQNCPFVYNENWEKMRYSFLDVDGNDLTMVYDLKSSKFIIANLTTNEVFTKSNTDALSFYANRTGNKINSAQLASFLPGVNVVFNPLEPFGLSEDKRFNIYKHSKYLEILNSEIEYTTQEILESKSCKSLAFFKHLFKDYAEYFLAFLKTKFTTFEYSPTTFCLFDDEGGAGKGALEVLLGKFIGGEKLTRVPFDTFQSKFTSDYEGKLIVFFNEFPEDYKIRKSNTDKIKEMTGSPTLKIEKKGQDPYEIDNLATFFITSNRISVEIKEGDRRFFVVQCDKKFDDVFDDKFFSEITSDKELEKLAIFLKYNVNALDRKLYMSPPNSDAKELFVDCVESDVDIAIKNIIEKNFGLLFDLDRQIINFKANGINLTKLADKLGVKTRTLTQAIRRKIGQGKLDCVIQADTNKTFGEQANTYGIVRDDLSYLKPKMLQNKVKL